MATIDTANVRISKLMTLWPEASFTIAAFDKSFVTRLSDEAISCGLLINEAVVIL